MLNENVRKAEKRRLKEVIERGLRDIESSVDDWLRSVGESRAED